MLHLYRVSIKDKATSKIIDLKVKAHSTDEATNSVTAALFGHNGPYTWLGSGPLYKNNKLIDIEE